MVKHKIISTVIYNNLWSLNKWLELYRTKQKVLDIIGWWDFYFILYNFLKFPNFTEWKQILEKVQSMLIGKKLKPSSSSINNIKQRIKKIKKAEKVILDKRPMSESTRVEKSLRCSETPSNFMQLSHRLYKDSILMLKFLFYIGI